MKSLDVWRVDDGLVRESWALRDLSDAWQRLGSDVVARLRTVKKSRTFGDIVCSEKKEGSYN